MLLETKHASGGLCLCIFFPLCDCWTLSPGVYNSHPHHFKIKWSWICIRKDFALAYVIITLSDHMFWICGSVFNGVCQREADPTTMQRLAPQILQSFQEAMWSRESEAWQLWIWFCSTQVLGPLGLSVVRPARIMCDMEAEWPVATFCPGMLLVGLSNFLVRSAEKDSDSVQSEKPFATMCHVAGADGQLGGHARPTCCSSSVGRIH